MRQIQNAYSRILIDNHIADIDPSFMTGFDPVEYVRMVRKAGVDLAMIYACCHNGNCYYPTKVGHIHGNLKGRDIFGEIVSLLNTQKIIPIAYYTVCWHNDSAKNNPDWQFTDLLGRHHYGRYWMCCPNNPEYRIFVKAQLEEITAYNIAGVFVDMTFWPGICFCQNCKSKYKQRHSEEIPVKIDWCDPNWVRFQRCREDWMTEFATEITESIKKQKPDITVTHQFAPVLLGWYLSLNSSFVNAVDYPSGDFYGGRDQQRLGTKILSAFTKDLPYEFMTSRCVNLCDHTSTKSEDRMFCSAATTLANGGAYFFIDAINPDGTLEKSTFGILEKISSRLLPFKEKIAQKKPKLLSDVGLYFSMASNIDISLNGKTVEEVINSISVSNMDTLTKSRMIDEIFGTSLLLNQLFIPYSIITDRNKDLSQYKTIIINDVFFMSTAEVKRLRQFVDSGGILIATGRTSISDINGISTGDFALKDVFGVSYAGNTSSRVNYLCNDSKYIACNYPSVLVKAENAGVLATISEPVFNPDDPDNYASIHSNPPGRDTDYAALTVNNYGKGTCVYMPQSLFAIQQDSQQSFMKAVLKEYVKSDIQIETNLPGCAELTILGSSCDNSLLMCIVNYQKELPNIQLKDIYINLRMPRKAPVKCTRVSNNNAVEFKYRKDCIEFGFCQIDDFEIIEILFQEDI